MRSNFALLVVVLFALLTPCVFAEAAADAFASAEAKYQHGQYKEALEEYRAFHAKYPSDWRAEQAQITAAFILQKKIKDTKQAADAYKRVSEQKTNGQLTRIAKFHLAEAYELSGDIPKAIATLEDLRGKTPEHTREREINRRLKFLRRAAKDESGELQGWGYGLKGKKWRKLNKAMGAPAPM